MKQSAARRNSILLASRTWEQAALGIGMLVLASRLQVREFAPVSALLVVNSLAVTMSDFGLGLAVLRLTPGQAADRSARRQVRLVNGAVLAAGVVVGAVVGGDVGAIVGWGAAVWAVSAEAYVRKSAAIRFSTVGQVAVGELLGGVAFLGAIVVFASPERAVVVTGAALAAKHVIEAASIRVGRDVFADVDGGSALRTLWSTQVLAFLIANVDYVVVAPLLGASEFAVYVLAFRIASVIPSQVAGVTTRVSLAEFADAPDAAHRRSSYERFTTRLMAAGVVGVVATLAVLPLVPIVLGDRWRPAVGVAAVLSVSVPWRLVIGVAGTLMISMGEASRLVRWEVSRLAAVVIVYGVAATVSLAVFTVAVAAVAVIASVFLHARAARAASFPLPRMLWPAAAGSIALVVLCAPLVQSSL